jgi:uncharacterized membrane protein HdeD (DUF308 family)
MKTWKPWLASGIVSMLGGAVALADPFAASVAAEIVIAWTFIVAGTLTLVSALLGKGLLSRIGAALLGAVLAAIGIGLLIAPLAGLVVLTVAMASGLVAGGLARVAIAASRRGRDARLSLLLSGGVSLLLAVLIVTDLALSTAIALGLVLAVELISNGVSLTALALTLRRRARLHEASYAG